MNKWNNDNGDKPFVLSLSWVFHTTHHEKDVRILSDYDMDTLKTYKLLTYLLTYFFIRRYNRFAVLVCSGNLRNGSRSHAFVCQPVIPVIF